MSVARAVETRPLVGSPRPRIAPPVPARSDISGFRDQAKAIGIDLMPWQETVARYLEAKDADDRALYREVALVVARQNGKTEVLVPLIVKRLQAGGRIMHTAQDRALPREVFYRVSDYMWEHHRDLFPLRNGRQTKPRYANGQEEIRLTNGGVYAIVAPTRGGARGPSRDLVIIDELREMDTWDFIAASKPTLTTSKSPQTFYLSNAGDETSVVLNALRDRAQTDPKLAYLEWSAEPDLTADDVVGWAQANPSLGNERGEMGPIVDTLTDDYRTAKLEGTLALFETEHLCRWVSTMRAVLVSAAAWTACAEDRIVRGGVRGFMGVSMAPEGTRASIAVAWQSDDGRVALRAVHEVRGNPIDAAELGREMKRLVTRYGVREVGYDPMTDAELAKYAKTAKPITGQAFANASSRFVHLVEAGRLAWDEAGAITDDLTWTSRKEHDPSGTFVAVRSLDDRPVTAALASIRAVWLASGPPRTRRARVY